MNPSVLIIDDEKTIRDSLSFFFKGKGCETCQAAGGAEGISLARDAAPDLVILDQRLPDMSGMDALAGIRAVQPDSVVIILTAYGSISGAVDAMRAGAFDYLVKPVDMDALEVAVERAAYVQGLKKENVLLKSLSEARPGEEIAGESPEVHKLLLMIDLLAENANTTVLIEGESGTGKELAARKIHGSSGRKGRPFVEINCASLSESLLESDLFGHERGAFTDAKTMKRGLLEVAHGGTLFLDEVGEMSLSLQPKLLRVIETRQFRRVGGTRDTKVDVRIIAATNRNLAEAVAARAFREDLYYRLRVMPLVIPPLRDRGSDVLVLARRFLSEMTQGVKKDIRGMSRQCEGYLLRYPWPGNVRELKNVVERAVIIADGPYIGPEHLPKELTVPGGAPAPMETDGPPMSLHKAEMLHVLGVMDYTGGNQSEAARILGLSRSTLISKLKKYKK